MHYEKLKQTFWLLSVSFLKLVFFVCHFYLIYT